jgi:hypothetical protein
MIRNGRFPLSARLEAVRTTDVGRCRRLGRLTMTEGRQEILCKESQSDGLSPCLGSGRGRRMCPSQSPSAGCVAARDTSPEASRRARATRRSIPPRQTARNTAAGSRAATHLVRPPVRPLEQHGCAVDGHLPEALDETAIVTAAQDRSIGLYPMSRYRASGQTRPPDSSSDSATSASPRSNAASQPSPTSSAKPKLRQPPNTTHTAAPRCGCWPSTDGSRSSRSSAMGT